MLQRAVARQLRRRAVEVPSLLPPGRIRNSVLLVAALITGGTAGYMTLAGFSFLEALYQTIMTIAPSASRSSSHSTAQPVSSRSS